nr:hypothetical protein [Tanacetum cinerariifolium]
MQTQTSNTLYNAIMDAGSKDHPPMLAPGNYVQWKSRIKRYIDTKPNHELIHYCLENPPYKLDWKDIEVPNSSTRSQQTANRNRGKEIVNSPQPIYDQEPSMVAEDDETSKDKEIDKLMALISLSFKKICKPTNNNLRTSSNTSRANQDNSLRINRNAGYEIQRIGNVAGARETVGSTVVQKSGIQCYNCKEFEHVAREQADWRDDTDDDELEDQELEAHYMYMAQLQQVSPDAADSGPIFDDEPLQKVSNDDHYNVFAIKRTHPEQSESVLDTYPIEQDVQNVIIDSLDIMMMIMILPKNMELECAKVRGDLLSYKMDYQKSCTKYTDTINAINQTISEMKDRLSAHQETISILSKQKEAQIKLYKTREDKELDKVIELENKDLKAQLQDKGIVISELKKLIGKQKGKFVDTKFEKSSVIRQPNAFKIQRSSVLSKPTTFSNSFVRKDFSKSTSVTQTHVSNNFSKLVTAQTLPTNKKSIVQNTNLLAPVMYKLHTDHTQTRTSQLPQDSKKTNKRVSISTGVIPTTSVSIPQLKSNPHGDRVMHNNSQGKKQTVEDHRRSVKLSKNKTSVTACNDSLNAKTLNVKSVSAMCDKCVLHGKHDMCVLKSVSKPLKETVASESSKKPRNFTRKLYELVSKTCSWWYPKFTPSGYK